MLRLSKTQKCAANFERTDKKHSTKTRISRQKLRANSASHSNKREAEGWGGGWKDPNQKLCKVSFAALRKFGARNYGRRNKDTSRRHIRKYAEIFVHQKAGAAQKLFAPLKGSRSFFSHFLSPLEAW